jgi:hypothetical protein
MQSNIIFGGAVTKVARNTAGGAKFTSTTMGISVHAAEWRQELHQPIKGREKNSGDKIDSQDCL